MTTILTIMLALYGLVIYFAIGVKAMLVYCKDEPVLNVEMPPWKEFMALLIWPIPVVAAILRTGILNHETDPE